MKIQEQANNSNNLNDPTVANDPNARVEFDDLPMSGEQEEQVKGGASEFARHIQIQSLSSPLTGTSGEQTGAIYSNSFSCLPSALPLTGTSGEQTGAITTRRS